MLSRGARSCRARIRRRVRAARAWSDRGGRLAIGWRSSGRCRSACGPAADERVAVDDDAHARRGSRARRRLPPRRGDHRGRGRAAGARAGRATKSSWSSSRRRRRRRWRPASGRFVTSAACGVCGRESLDGMAHGAAARRSASTPAWRRRWSTACRRRCAQAQPTFDRTGGLHAAGLFVADGALARRARGRRAPQRRRQAGGHAAARRAACPPATAVLMRERARELRAGPEGGGRRASRSSPPSARRRAWRSSWRPRRA